MTVSRRLPLLLVAAAVALAGCVSGGSRSGSPIDDNQNPYAEAAVTNVQLAAGYLSQGRVEIALEKVNRALALDPSFADAHGMAGIIHDQIGDVDSARKHYRRAVQLDGTQGRLLNNYGQFLCKTGDLKAGLEHLRRAIEDPFYETPAAALTNSGACHERVDQLADAERFYRRALSVDEGFPDALYRMARLQMGRGEAFRARAFLQRFEAVSPPFAESLELGVRIETALDNPEAAEQYAERLQRLFPESTQSRDARRSE